MVFYTARCRWFRSGVKLLAAHFETGVGSGFAAHVLVYDWGDTVKQNQFQLVFSFFVGFHVFQTSSQACATGEATNSFCGQLRRCIGIFIVGIRIYILISPFGVCCSKSRAKPIRDSKCSNTSIHTPKICSKSRTAPSPVPRTAGYTKHYLKDLICNQQFDASPQTFLISDHRREVPAIETISSLPAIETRGGLNTSSSSIGAETHT